MSKYMTQRKITRKVTAKGERVQARIVSAARRLFNQDGLEYVGIREIAAAVDLEPGHVTYYFPSKEDIVLALAEELRALNNRTVPAAETLTVAAFLARFEQMLENHVAYRCLLLSMPRLRQQYPKVRAHYRQTTSLREDDLRVRFRTLVEARALRPLSSAEEAYLVSCCSLIVRGWLAECLTAGHSPKARVPHYVALLEGMLRPFLLPPP